MKIEDTKIEVTSSSAKELCEEIEFVIRAKVELRNASFIEGKLWWDYRDCLWKGKLTFTN